MGKKELCFYCKEQKLPPCSEAHGKNCGVYGYLDFNKFKTTFY